MSKHKQSNWFDKRDENTAETLTIFSTDPNRQLGLQRNKGFTIAPQKILRCFRLSDSEKLLLLDLFSYLGKSPFAFPSHNTLTFGLGKKGTGSIKAALNSLRDKKFIWWDKGGGDLGTNHYKVHDLYTNPFVIMSELTHFYKDIVLFFYRSNISYENLYGPILDIVSIPKSKQLSENDVYGMYIKTLLDEPESNHDVGFILHYFTTLDNHIKSQSNAEICIDWNDVVIKELGKTDFGLIVNPETRETFYL
jgi:hypothetical protein